MARRPAVRLSCSSPRVSPISLKMSELPCARYSRGREAARWSMMSRPPAWLCCQRRIAMRLGPLRAKTSESLPFVTQCWPACPSGCTITPWRVLLARPVLHPSRDQMPSASECPRRASRRGRNGRSAMRIETLRDRHYRRYRHAAASRSAATRTASAQLTSKTADCPEPGAFAIVDEVYWLLVVAAQLGWPFPGLLLSKLRPSLNYEFDIETVRYLVRKEPKVHVLLLASAGLRVRLLDPKLANERMASIQASGSPISRDPKYGLWPVQSPRGGGKLGDRAACAA
ncbi:hypothetical protein ABIE41_003775 [Bosea sp. OAE506]